ncbi:1,4-alpha-glucan-branching enzyme [Candidatus Saccharibacteria bacterium oral taxon 488]|nr:1,4-alpha-glucan-branching enzyme [Candidatus Saccharibacteria bacterium oral taxon 488]QLF52055.1 alpha amylase C-terminal domain-containing protein [Candidatus Saccharibacteria bacterium oral taxon 488]
MSKKTLVELDPWLAPHEPVIKAREAYVSSTLEKVLDGKSPADFALGFHHFGLHRTQDGWIFREWAPNATHIVMVGDFSDWQEREEFTLQPGAHGEWSVDLPRDALHHGQKYKLRVYWPGGAGWRLPSYATYVIQDDDSVDFSAVVWQPDEPYQWQHNIPSAPNVPLIYEAHVGMSSEEEKVASFNEFTANVLPRIKQAGYNTIQLMAIAEHPYYGSFGYHVSNFFAVSSRFGTPDDCKRLVDAAHRLGLRVIIDIVHAHAAKNEVEGLGNFAGDPTQYFKAHDHPAWDSRLFNYGKPEVLHFLASNCRWWLDEYHVDGFRFDGVTSMLYHDHGLGKSFTSYDDYFTGDIDKDALVYLRLANDVIHAVRPDATTIAEEMSGLPGLAAPTEHGGLGFDYRLAMGAPDLWIKTLKEKRDEDWDLGELAHTLSSHRPEEKVITYAESHDQALVGDKTLIFRLIDKAMYWRMNKADPDLTVERGIALHKLIRLLTAGLHGGGYLNFMGNEFGHPEWIDFPRQGNNWSFKHARRQWSLRDNGFLKYQWLGEFDASLMKLIKTVDDPGIHYLTIHQHDHVVSFMRDNLLFIMNFSPSQSWTGYSVPAAAGSYRVALSSDDQQFGGQGRVDPHGRYFTTPHNDEHIIRVYIPARSGLVLQKD